RGLAWRDPPRLRCGAAEMPAVAKRVEISCHQRGYLRDSKFRARDSIMALHRKPRNKGKSGAASGRTAPAPAYWQVYGIGCAARFHWLELRYRGGGVETKEGWGSRLCTSIS